MAVGPHDLIIAKGQGTLLVEVPAVTVLADVSLHARHSLEPGLQLLTQWQRVGTDTKLEQMQYKAAAANSTGPGFGKGLWGRGS